MKYESTPIDTLDVDLPCELHNQVELLAKNAHDLWERQRVEDGWMYGEYRDDSKKLHPCLIAYQELPEAEKEYDRLSALGTLQAILKLGFTINSPAVS